VTFRNRVIFSTVGVATVAVLLACFASFLTARTSLIASVDSSLRHAALIARPHASGEDFKLSGAFSELILANGTTTPKSTVPGANLANNSEQWRSTNHHLESS